MDQNDKERQFTNIRQFSSFASMEGREGRTEERQRKRKERKMQSSLLEITMGSDRLW